LQLKSSNLDQNILKSLQANSRTALDLVNTSGSSQIKIPLRPNLNGQTRKIIGFNSSSQIRLKDNIVNPSTKKQIHSRNESEDKVNLLDQIQVIDLSNNKDRLPAVKTTHMR